jgi:hypothetical protein
MKPNILDKTDPFNMFSSAKKMKIEQPKLKVTELSIHNQVCKYLKAQYPNVMPCKDYLRPLLKDFLTPFKQNVK